MHRFIREFTFDLSWLQDYGQLIYVAVPPTLDGSRIDERSWSPQATPQAKGTRRDSPNPGPDNSLATPNTSMPGRVRSKRWHVHCFVQRKVVDWREMITIELPELSLRGPSDRDAAPSLSNDMWRPTPVFVAARRNTKKDEALLVELKERKGPKTLLEGDAATHLPNLTIDSLRCMTARN